MTRQVLFVGEFTPTKIKQITDEHSPDEDCVVIDVPFDEFFIVITDLIAKYDQTTNRKMVNGGEEEVLAPDKDYPELGHKHIASFGGPFDLIVIDHRSSVYGEREGYEVWQSLPSEMLLVDDDGYVVPFHPGAGI